MNTYDYALMELANGLSKVMAQTRILADATHAAIESMRVLNRAFMEAEMPIVGGEWPDRFVLLNRYVRTGVEPDWLSDERWTA